MNRTKLKNYAPQARRNFIQAVTDRAAFYGIAPTKTEPVIEQGDVAIIRGRAFPRSVVPKRQALISRIERQGFQQTMEAMAYTWFNRFVAIRFMELHGYFDHGYRVLSHPEGKQTPEILEHAEHVELPGLDRDTVIELKLDGAKEAELYRMLLVAQCNALHGAMPFLFEKIDDETELLLPDNLLHSDSLIRKLVREIEEEDWGQVEIIGWLYQFYISEKKDEVIVKVVKSEDIPAATQLFTPNWIVKYLVQNSVGRMWLQTYPASPLRSKMEYYIEPAEQTEEVKAQLAAITPAMIDPETITVLDPACGSGHILVEAYDLLKEIYLERGYRLRDVPRLILSKNLFGLDIDDRAAQLAAFALLMKARADDRRIFERMNEERDKANDNGQHSAFRIPHSAFPNVLAIQESAHLNVKQLASDLLNAPAQPKPMIDDGRLFSDFSTQPVLALENTKAAKAVDPAISKLQASISNLLALFRDAKTFGSLITIPDDVARQLQAIADVVNERLQSGNVWERPTAETILPFVRQGAILAGKYDCVIANPPYMGSKGMNIELKSFAAKCYQKSKAGLFAMFIERGFEMIKCEGFNAMVTMQSWMFLSSYAAMRESLLSSKTICTMAHLGPRAFAEISGEVVQATAFINFNRYFKHYRPSFFRLIDGDDKEKRDALLNRKWLHTHTQQDDFQNIPGSPLAYWITENVRAGFVNAKLLGEVASPKPGLSTANNDLFLRRWCELPFSKIGFGLGSCEEAQKSKFKWFPYNKGGALRKWYGNNELTVNWDDDGREIRNFKDASGYVRSRPQNTSFYFREGVTWSDITTRGFAARLSPQGFLFDIKGSSGFPPKSHKLVVLGLLCSHLSDLYMSILNPTVTFQVGDIARIPLIDRNGIIQKVEVVVNEAVMIARADWDSFETSWDFQTFPLLRADLKAAIIEQSFLNWQAHCQANIQRMQELETENNRLFIEAYGLQDELSPEVPEEQITLARADREADIRRLASYAVGCMMGRYSLDRPSLVYAESGNVRFDPSAYATFPADADGIVPTMDADWFADDAASRFVEFIGKAWPAEQMEENLRYVAESLNPARNESPRETIRRYFAQSFFKDHLKTYKKRPIYWLFSSGKQRAFQCLVYLHRYNEGTLARMRTEYAIPLQGKLAARIQQFETGKAAATSTSYRKKIEKEQDTLKKQQAELVAFDEKLRHFADQRIKLDLDDGVKANYGKFGDLLADVKAVTGGGEE